MQSVLVTIDRHEWYAPPQIYTRNDNTGYWTAKPALPPDSMLLASRLHIGITQISSNPVHALRNSVPVEREHHNSNEKWEDSCLQTQSIDHMVLDGSFTDDAKDVTKRRRIGDSACSERSIASNGSIHELKESVLMQTSNCENNDLSGNMAVSETSASLAEQVIEPTLVMFEVGPLSHI